MKNTIFSGMQPTGAVHLGNYLGALKQWVELQDKGSCVFCIVDYHAITVKYEPKEMKNKILNMAMDWIACGIDPKKSIMFVQSWVPEHTELAWIFNSIAPMGELERMTQFKEKSAQHKKNVNAGLFTYPILQAADILLYKTQGVPVGEDQVQHIELARDIAKKFNKTFKKIFPEPRSILTQNSRIMSLVDPSKKMSKSLGEKHCISLVDSPDEIKKKIRSSVTDSIAGSSSLGVKNLFTILEALDKGIAQEMKKEHKAGKLKYSSLKDVAANSIISHFAPIQQKRKELENDKEKTAQILYEGARRASKTAKNTINEARIAIGIR